MKDQTTTLTPFSTARRTEKSSHFDAYPTITFSGSVLNAIPWQELVARRERRMDKSLMFVLWDGMLSMRQQQHNL
jgi:hypothetical protein